jgi:glycerol kinase
MGNAGEITTARLEDTFVAGHPRLELDMDRVFKKPRTTYKSLIDGTADFHTHHEDHLPQGILETEEERKQHWFVGSIDQGTTSSRFLIFNGEGDPVASHQIEFKNLYPKSGYVYPCSVPVFLAARDASRIRG